MPRRQERRDKLESRLASARRGKHGQTRGFTLCLQPADSEFLKDKWEYSYKFEPAPSQNDPIIRRIRQAIKELNGNSEYGVLMCNHNIRVVPSTVAPPIWPPHASDSEVKFYTFFQDEQEFPATAPVSVIPREGPLISDKIHVRQSGKWIPLKDWLVQLADESILSKRNASSIDYFWHKRNGRTFRLMDLPAELRLMVFERVIAPSGEVYPLNKVYKSGNEPSHYTAFDRENSHITLGIGYKEGGLNHMMYGREHPQENRKPVPPPNLVLLYVSKQIQAEALQAGWEGLKRCFVDHQIFTSVADSKIGVAQRFNILGRIQLNFTMKSWFKFFGLEVEPVLFRTESASLGRYLAALEDTCRLELRFRDPEDGYWGDPWKCGKTTCQTVMIDWVMTFAFEHIKHIKHVDLVGYIKKPQKLKWLSILAKERADTDYNFDHAAAIQAILATAADDL